MNRILRERYKYTAPDKLLAANAPLLTEEVVFAEITPALLSSGTADADALSRWAGTGAEGDPLWEENLSATAVQGMQIRIPRSAGAADGILYIHLRYPAGTAGAGSQKVFVRNTIHLEENTRARVVIYHHHSDNAALTVNAVTAIEAEYGAELELTEVAETQATLAETVVIRQQGNSHVSVTYTDLDNILLRRNQFVTLSAAEAECDLAGVYVTDGEQHADNYIRIDHAVADCRSNQLFKGVMDGRSTAAFTGHIHVARDAQRTAAFQENHNIVLSDTARINTRPQLEIYADDVKCNHGATVGMLDAEAIYYMRQRGIGLGAARRLQIEGFIGEIVDRSGNDELSHLVRDKVTRRLQSL